MNKIVQIRNVFSKNIVLGSGHKINTFQQIHSRRLYLLQNICESMKRLQSP
jgi:hypothetical protein